MALSEDRHPAALSEAGPPDDLTHISEVLAESGIPVADTLKDKMFAEMLSLTQSHAQTVHREDGQLRSA